MAWEKTASGDFERPLGENEAFIKFIGDSSLSVGREHWAIFATATVIPRGRLLSEDWRFEYELFEAWKALHLLQPSIAARVVDNKIIFQTPDLDRIESWAKKTFIIQPAHTKVEDIVANRKPSPWTTLHYLPTSSELVLQTSHWRTDGIGVLYILDEYLELICKLCYGSLEPIPPGSESSRLAPSIEEAANNPQIPTPELKAIAEKYTATFALTTNQVGVKYHGDPNLPPGGTRFRSLQFTESKTAAIATASRSRELSVTSILHASVAAANYAFATESAKSKPFTSTIRFGLRNYLPEPYCFRTYGSALYTSGYMHQVPSSNSWSQNAAAFNTEYRKGYSSILPAHREYARQLGHAIRNMLPQTGPPDSNIDISSVGVVDSIIQPDHESGDASVEITAVSVGVHITTRQMVCFVWTFRGRLNLRLVYNEAYHAAEEVDEILRFIRKTTLEELGVPG